MAIQMNEGTINYQVKTVSLPDTLWKEVDAQAEEWGAPNRSATIRRIVEEWKALRKAVLTQNGSPESANIIIIAA